MRRGFTLVELFVVMAILAVLIGTMSLSVSRAQQRARIATAQTTVREITHAILSYQNYDDEGSLANYLMEEQPANEGKLGFILGRVKARGVDVPVLYNAALVNGEIRDPWGRPYRVTVRVGEKVSPPGVQGMRMRVFCPNWHRLTGGER